MNFFTFALFLFVLSLSVLSFSGLHGGLTLVYVCKFYSFKLAQSRCASMFWRNVYTSFFLTIFSNVSFVVFHACYRVCFTYSDLISTLCLADVDLARF